ncbi:MAG: glycosyltransferase [Brevinema sp.]
MKIALAHEWLVTMGGAENVLEQMSKLYTKAPIYTLFADKNEVNKRLAINTEIITSSMQHIPMINKIYRKLPNLFPKAVEEFDFREYDIVLSSSHAVMKGLLTDAKTCHICYMHTPMRYIWDLTHEYLEQANFPWPLSWYTKNIFHYLRNWDSASALRPDYLIANSHFIKNRIRKIYRRDAVVIYPPVELSDKIYTNKENYFVTASRHVPYKNIPLIAAAFAKMKDKKLVILGDGPDAKKVAEIARNAPNIEYLGYQNKSILMETIGKAKAFVFAAEEDFGILPVEAQSLGTPVIAFGVGGSCETVQENVTGLFFMEQTIDSMEQAVRRFELEEDKFDPLTIAAYSQKFSVERFQKELDLFVQESYKQFLINNDIK